MTMNLSQCPSEIESSWVWPATAPLLPGGLPVGVLTLVRVRKPWTEAGVQIFAEMFKSVVDSGLRGALVIGNGGRVLGPAGGAAAVNVYATLDALAPNARLAGVSDIDACLPPQVVGATVAAAVAGSASTYGQAATVGFWWESADGDAEATHTLEALIRVAHVVIDVVGSDADGPLLTVSIRPSADADLPYQRLVPRP